MRDKLKNAITISITVLAMIPFVLLTDLFPFFRFGMFAEPLKSSIQTEYFQIAIIYNNDKEAIFDPQETGVNSIDFNYLCRNYFYRKEGEAFLRKLSGVYNKKGIREWTIKRTTYSAGKENKSTVARIILQP
jgi:hypothetical protein